jgi:hypothetical protein
MTTGTITLTTNSDAVTGIGTSFSTELENGDFIVAEVGGISYTLAIKTIDSNTGLTLVNKYTGPTMSGLGFEVVTKNAMSMITAAIVVQNTEALRGMNYDKQNWQQLFTGTGTITVKLPDNSTWTGPAWNGFTAELDKKATLNSDGVLPLDQGGTGRKTPFGNAANTFCQGNDSRLSTVGGKSGGGISSTISVNGRVGAARGYGLGVGTEQGGNHRVEINAPTSEPTTSNAQIAWTAYRWYDDNLILAPRRGGGPTLSSYTIQFGSTNSIFTFLAGGNATAPGTWTNGSDERHKYDIETVEDPLASVISWRGVTYSKLDGGREVGLIAQDVERACPEAIITIGDKRFTNNTVVPGFKYLNTSGVASAFHTEAIKALVDIIELSIDDPASAKQRLTEIKSAATEISRREISNDPVYIYNAEKQEDKE